MTTILVRQGKNWSRVSEYFDGKFNSAFARLIVIHQLMMNSECVCISEDRFQETFPGFRLNEPLSFSYACGFQSHSDTPTVTIKFTSTTAVGEL